MMRATNNGLCGGSRNKGLLRGWMGLAAGLGLIWVMAYVILPWGQTLPHIRPIMQAIVDSNVDAGTYWYTQSEKTVIAQEYVRNAIRNK